MVPFLFFFVAWYNLPFTLLILLCLILAGMQWLGLGGEEHNADHDFDQDADADANLDHDLDANAELHGDYDHDLDQDASADQDVDQDADHDLDHEMQHDAAHETDHEAAHGGGAGFSVLAYVGAGKAPLMVVLLILCGSVGVLGWALNALVQGIFGAFPGLAMVITLPGALLAGSFISARTSRLIGSLLPPLSTTAVTAQGLVGHQAVVTSPWVDEKYGKVRLRDPAGTLLSLFAVLDAPAATPIRRGEQVTLVSYDKGKKVYRVVGKK